MLAPLLTVAFVIGSVLAWRAALRDGQRQRRSVRAQGVVTQVEWNAEQQVFPTVRFVTADGQPVQARPASSSNVARFVVGQQVSLRYDPEQPDWILLDGLPGAGCAGLAAAIVLSVGALVLALVTVALLL